MSQRRDERGAILPMVAIMMTLLIGIGALAVDLGTQRVGRRDMQSLSDVVALDLARQLNGRTAAEIKADSAWHQALTESVARNRDTVGTAPTVTPELGTLDLVTGAFLPLVDDGAVPTAVRVTASTSVDFSFAPGKGSATRSAVAGTDSEACFALGSYAVAMQSGDSALLNALIGDALNLGVLGYNGIATSSISLLGLSSELGVGTVEELAALDGIQVGDFYLAIAHVLQQNGDTANAVLLESIAAQVGSLPSIAIADVIALDGAGAAALSTNVNAFDLVAGAAFVANGNNALAIPNLSVKLGLTDLNASLHVVERPRIACGAVGRAKAHTSQVSLDVTGDVLKIPHILGLDATAAVDLHLALAEASGTLSQILCGPPDALHPEGIDVSVASALTSLNLSIPIHLEGKLAVTGHPGLVGVKVDLTVSAGTTKPAESNIAQIRIPPDTYQTPRPVGGDVALSGLAIQQSDLVITATLLGLPLTLPLPAINGLLTTIDVVIVKPLVKALDDLLLGPVSDLLGLRLGGADVFALPRPTCDQPALRG